MSWLCFKLPFVYFAISGIRPKMKTHFGLHNILIDLKHVKSALSFGNLLFIFNLGQILYLEYLLGYLYGRTYKLQLSS